MIYFLARNPEPFRDYLANCPPSLGEHARLITYAEVAGSNFTPGHTYVFADLERLTADERRRALGVSDRLAAADVPSRVLNHPRRVLGRYDLLMELRRRGVNTHTARRMTELGRVRFPVFLRREDDHRGPATRLLWTKDELFNAVCWLSGRGKPLRRYLAVEFCDTVDHDGFYTRYRAYRVGDQIIPFSIRVGRHWMLKSETATVPTQTQLSMEATYLEANPHEDWLKQIFRVANVDFGAVDYSFEGGQPRVWEINTNPDAFSGPPPARVPGQREVFAECFAAALFAVDCSPNSEGSPGVTVAPGASSGPSPPCAVANDAITPWALTAVRPGAGNSAGIPLRRRRHLKPVRTAGKRVRKRLRSLKTRLGMSPRVRRRIRRLRKRIRRLRKPRLGRMLAVRALLPLLWWWQKSGLRAERRLRSVLSSPPSDRPSRSVLRRGRQRLDELPLGDRGARAAAIGTGRWRVLSTRKGSEAFDEQPTNPSTQDWAAGSGSVSEQR